MEKVKQYYEDIASQYDTSLQKWGYKDLIEEYINLAKISLGTSPRILDVGCGTGIAMAKLQDMYPNAEIVGLDISANMLALCKQKMPEVMLVQGDYNKQEFFNYTNNEKLTFEPQSFDLIISTGSLTEYGDLPAALPFLYSLLKPEGYLANIGHRKGFINWIVLLFWRGKSTGRKEFIAQCTQIGFESAQAISMSLTKNIWAWRKYCAVAQRPAMHHVENFNIKASPVIAKQKLETSFS